LRRQLQFTTSEAGSQSVLDVSASFMHQFASASYEIQSISHYLERNLCKHLFCCYGFLYL